MDTLHSVIDFLTDTVDLSNSITLAIMTIAFLGLNRIMPLKFGIPIVVTGLLAGSALYIIFTENMFTRNEQWAYAAAGALFGFWMRRVEL